MIQETLHKYCYRIGWRQIWNVLLGVGLIGFSVFLYFRFDIDTSLIVLITVFSILGIIPLLITFHYYIVSKEIKILIHTDKDRLEIFRNGKKLTFTLNDVTSVEIHEHKGLGLYEFDFDYAKYNLKKGKYFVATNFMTSEYYIPNDIEPSLKKVFLPIVWKVTNLESK